MPETNLTQTGAYHLSDNPSLYEVQRSNNFEFIVTGIDNILRVDADANDDNAYIANASQTLRFSVVSSSIPMFTQDVITIKRGNSVMKGAGVPTFGDGSLVVNDFIGADTKSVLMAWQRLSYDVKTERVGNMADYKKICYLCEYAPNYQLVRTWKLVGCWVSGLSENDFNMEDGSKQTITATIQYDKAYMELPSEI